MPVPPVCELDVDRMRGDRLERLHAAMRQHGVDALCVLTTANVAYATGVTAPGADAARAAHERAVAIVSLDAEPVVFAPLPPTDLPTGVDVRPGPLDLDDPADARRLAASLPPGRLAVDDLTMALAAATASRDPVDAAPVFGAAKIVKTVDELECIRRAQTINELAMTEIVESLAPGVRTRALAADFLAAAAQGGADQPVLDPVFQVMAPSIALGPFSVTGDPVFPTTPRDATLASGDVVWVDTGIAWHGYHSDFGRTWVVGEPTPVQRAQHDEWTTILRACCDATRPGATGRDLTRAAARAARSERPWLDYFYLAHGIGTASAEMPLVGTDLGEAFDASLVLAPGMVLVFEPVVWEDGAGGYRAEEIVAVTDDGCRPLSSFTFAPFEDPR